MIRINLLGDETAIDNSGRMYLFGYVAALVVTVIVAVVLQHVTSGEIDLLTEENQGKETELARLKKVTDEVRGLEGKRNELNDKLVLIATLKRSKTGPVRVLDDLNRAMPKKAWLSEVKETSGTLRMTGLALDNPTIADFMKDLESSDYFDNVDLEETKQSLRDGVKIKAFAVRSRVNYAGKIKEKPVDAKHEPVASPSPSASQPGGDA